MAASAQRVATFEELYEAIQALPEGITGEILVDGVIETMGRPGRGHIRAAMWLARGLIGLGDEDERRGWVIEHEREVRLLGSRLAVPDLSGWRILDGNADFLDANPVDRVPDWACEILSDSTRRKDRTEKLPLYARAGIPIAWLVDPDGHFVEVYESREGLPVHVVTARGDERASLAPFDLEIDLHTLWVPRRP